MHIILLFVAMLLFDAIHLHFISLLLRVSFANIIGRSEDGFFFLNSILSFMCLVAFFYLSPDQNTFCQFVYFFLQFISTFGGYLQIFE